MCGSKMRTGGSFSLPGTGWGRGCRRGRGRRGRRAARTRPAASRSAAKSRTMRASSASARSARPATCVDRDAHEDDLEHRLTPGVVVEVAWRHTARGRRRRVGCRWCARHLARWGARHRRCGQGGRGIEGWQGEQHGPALGRVAVLVDAAHELDDVCRVAGEREEQRLARGVPVEALARPRCAPPPGSGARSCRGRSRPARARLRSRGRRGAHRATSCGRRCRRSTCARRSASRRKSRLDAASSGCGVRVARQLHGDEAREVDRRQGCEHRREVDLALAEGQVLVHTAPHVVDLHVGDEVAGPEHAVGGVGVLRAAQVPHVDA